MNWKDVIELNNLFDSESMHVSHGEYIDQRFIDYLYRNFSDIDKIHWRKLEQLTAEYFHKSSWDIKLGAGRNDDGVDIRVSKKSAISEHPEVILIQCKRQKKKVEKIVVKALWADVLDKNATSGLIVTTSKLSPGAQKVCSARSYRIDCADRMTLKNWLNEMRSPGTGVFLGE